jgi:hypothetical protein
MLDFLRRNATLSRFDGLKRSNDYLIRRIVETPNRMATARRRAERKPRGGGGDTKLQILR